MNTARHRRVLAGVGDQALSSGTNFLTSFVAARLLTKAEFGTVVVVLGVAVVGLTLQRALVGDTLLAYASGQPADERRRMERDGLTAALGLGVVAGVVAIAAGLLPFALTDGMGWMGIWLPAVLVQDAYRYIFYCDRQPERALFADLAWLVVQVAALVAIALLGLRTIPYVLGAWGLGAAAGAVVGMLVFRAHPLGGRPLRWLAETRHLSGWFGGQTILAQAHSQVIVFFVAGVLGKAAIGGLRAIQLLLVMPVQSLLLAAQSLIVPGLARLAAAGDRARVEAQTRRLVALFAGAAFVVAALVVAFRRPFIALVFGREFLEFADLMLPVAVATVFYAARAPFTAACRALQNARGTFVIQLLYTGITVPAACLGAVRFGVLGAAWGITLGSAVLLCSALWVYRSTISRMAPAAGPSGEPGGRLVSQNVSHETRID